MVQSARTLSAVTVCAAMFAMVASGVGAAEKKYAPGVTDSEIKLGQTMPYSGNASAFGIVGRIQAAYFKMINARGGVNGRRINLVSLDDGFSPPKTVEQIRRLVEEEKVYAIFGSVGTPPNIAIAKYLNTQAVPHLLFSSGAPRWADPANTPWSLPFYVQQDIEAAIYARYLAADTPGAKIAVLYQNDEFGKGYLAGFRAGLGDKAAAMIVKEAGYELSDATIDSQLFQLKASGADTLFSASTPKFAAQTIRRLAEMGWKPRHVVIAAGNSVSATLRPAGVENAVGMLTSVFLKAPDDRAWADDAAMQAYLAFMKEWAPNEPAGDLTPVLAYMTSELMVGLLAKCGDDLSREKLMAVATDLEGTQLPLMLPGIKLSITPKSYTSFRQAVMARFDGTDWKPFGGPVSADGR